MLNAQYVGGLMLTLELESKAPLVRGDKSRRSSRFSLT